MDFFVQGTESGKIWLAMPAVALNDYLAVPRWTRWTFHLEAALRKSQPLLDVAGIKKAVRDLLWCIDDRCCGGCNNCVLYNKLTTLLGE